MNVLHNSNLIEQLLSSIRNYNLWQLVLLLLCGSCQIFITMLASRDIFGKIYPTDFACDIQNRPEDWSIEQLKRFTSAPRDYDNYEWITLEDDACIIYDINYTSLISDTFENSIRKRDDLLSLGDPPQKICAEFVFNSEISSSIAERFGLVCSAEHQRYRSFAWTWWCTIIRIAGMLLCGVLGDFLIGRRILLTLSLGLTTVAGVGLSLASNHNLYLVFDAVLTILTYVTTVANYCYMIEWTTKSLRTPFAVILLTAWVFGRAILSLISFIFGNYTAILLFCALPQLAYAIVFWFLPENPRHLLARGRLDEVQKFLSKKGAKEDSISDYKFSDKFNWTLLFRLCLLLPIWFSGSIIYYFLAVSTASFSNDIFINNALYALPELVGSAIALGLLYLGRKIPIPLLFLCTVFFYVLAYLVAANVFGFLSFTNGWLFVVAQVFFSALGTIKYVLGIETLPTKIRLTGFSLLYAAALLGSFLAPYLFSLHFLDIAVQLKEWLQHIVIALLIILSSVCVFFLPETKGLPLLQSFEDSKQLSFRRRQPQMPYAAFYQPNPTEGMSKV